MGRKCLRCGSENTVKVYPAGSIIIPEIKKEIEAGTAITACCSAGCNHRVEYKCRDCGFKWDDLIEKGMKE
ncbi:MAG: hypothetical protein VB031_04945 [Eubacteriaceae bacterium]|nr:hypothetical protein [Eubacteriaceae bacterium]